VSEVGIDQFPRLLGLTPLNLLRRGADGSLRLSADRWIFERADEAAIVFRSDHPPGDPERQTLEVPRSDLRRVTWDRLPRQRTRAQLRFHLTNGDLWTFSGPIDAPDPPAES
jgi:hypothetical protein